jgi:hypothetical protein
MHCSPRDSRLSGEGSGDEDRQTPQGAQAEGQEQQWHAQPQTAALPRRSGPTQLLYDRLIAPPDDSVSQAVQLDAAESRESNTDDGQWKPICKR